jgi:TolA-binding protein
LRQIILWLLPLRLFAQEAPSASPEAAPSAPVASISAPVSRIVPQEYKYRSVVQSERKGEAENAYRYALEVMAGGSLARAEDLFSDFLIRFPGHDRTFDVRRARGEILRRQGRILEAAGADLHTCRLFSEQERGFDLCVRAARLFLRMGETDRARVIFQEVVQKYPASVPARIASVELSLMADGETPVSLPGKVQDQPTSETREDRPGEDETPGEGVFDANTP